MSTCIACDVIVHDMLQNHKLKKNWWQCLKNSDSLITVPEEAEVEWRVEWKGGGEEKGKAFVFIKSPISPPYLLN